MRCIFLESILLNGAFGGGRAGGVGGASDQAHFLVLPSTTTWWWGVLTCVGVLPPLGMQAYVRAYWLVL